MTMYLRQHVAHTLTMRRTLRAAGVLLLSACATIHRPATTIPKLLADADAARVEGLEYLATAATAMIPGLTMSMQWTAIPSETAIDPAAASLFDKGWMRRLEELGAQRAASAKPWDSITSAYARPALLKP